MLEKKDDLAVSRFGIEMYGSFDGEEPLLLSEAVSLLSTRGTLVLQSRST